MFRDRVVAGMGPPAWRALTTRCDDRATIGKRTRERVVDWLAAGGDPSGCDTARKPARETMREVREIMSLSYT
jgi:hypothetical protein